VTRGVPNVLSRCLTSTPTLSTVRKRDRLLDCTVVATWTNAGSVWPLLCKFVSMRPHLNLFDTFDITIKFTTDSDVNGSGKTRHIRNRKHRLHTRAMYTPAEQPCPDCGTIRNPECIPASSPASCRATQRGTLHGRPSPLWRRF
jgi:hypothetical protein